MDGHLDYFHVLAIVPNAAVNTEMQIINVRWRFQFLQINTHQ